ncbi:MAG: restriction endonuclease subunit S, partial [Bacillota bacterium]|nr:restriction endonuclease subunit S [Bacillota bacterium]
MADSMDKKYSNVPNLRFSKYSDFLSLTNFGAVADYKKGPFGSALKKEIFVPKNSDTVKVYEQQNAINKDWTLERYFVTRDYAQKLKGFEVTGGDVLVSCAGTIGELYILPEDAETGIINQALMRIRTHNDINKYWFCYAFDNMIREFSNKYSNGSAIKNIPPFADLKSYPLSLPSLDEQNEIAELLKKIDERISTQNKIIRDLKVLIKRFLDFDYKTNTSEYEDVLLSSILTESKILNCNNNEVYSVAVEDGVVNQVEHLGRSFAAKDTSNYHVAKY